MFSLWRAHPPLDGAYQRGFRSDVMARVNEVRLGASVEVVGVDEGLQEFLAEYVERHPNPAEIDLDEVFDLVQKQFPGAQYLAANLVGSRDRDDLMGKLAGWTSAVSPEFGSINTYVFRSGSRMGAVGIMSRRIPAFDLRMANEKGGRFHNQCPHCDEVHALELAKDSRTLILSCPYCDLPFDILAADRKGVLHRVTDYLHGFSLEEDSSPGERKAHLIKLWRVVSERCRYELDQDAFQISEVWRHSHETWEERAGDCEDTSILLADVLISAGFEARVAIGWNGNIGQHAWVVVNLDGEQYVLESTLDSEITEESLKPVEAVSAFYQPEQLFDREQIYFTTAHPTRFRSDYFSPDLWKSLKTRSPKQSEFTLR